VARYADACNLFDIPDGGQTIRHKLAALARHCEAVGRPYEEIDKTVGTRLEPDEPPEAFIKRCAAFGQLGIEHVTVITNGPWTQATLGVLAAAVPALQRIAS
jgi:hypothetical protein